MRLTGAHNLWVYMNIRHIWICIYAQLQWTTAITFVLHRYQFTDKRKKKEQIINTAPSRNGNRVWPDEKKNQIMASFSSQKKFKILRHIESLIACMEDDNKN